jgi:hypothetical protein
MWVLSAYGLAKVCDASDATHYCEKQQQQASYFKGRTVPYIVYGPYDVVLKTIIVIG